MKGFGNPFEGFKEMVRGAEKNAELNEAAIRADDAYAAAVEARDENAVMTAIETLKEVGPKGYAEQLQSEWKKLNEDA